MYVESIAPDRQAERLRDRLNTTVPNEIVKLSARVDRIVHEFSSTSFQGRIKTKEIIFYELAKDVLDTHIANHPGVFSAYFRKAVRKSAAKNRNVHQMPA